ncbi:MAG TPA: Rieske (2Fe-2S) protein [Candidatus Dormibacteraeota bacterium]|nr:Rieske (2Fe-2S) protein [Candidatus Dormibacteraeota bacterium]
MAERLLLGDAADVPDRGLRTFKIGDTAVVVARVGGRYCAVDYRCPHMGGNLGRGRLEGGAVVCPIHGSRFDICTGEVREWAPSVAGVRLPRFARGLVAMGRRPAPVGTHAVEEDGGKLYLSG